MKYYFFIKSRWLRQDPNKAPCLEGELVEKGSKPDIPFSELLEGQHNLVMALGSNVRGNHRGAGPRDHQLKPVGPACKHALLVADAGPLRLGLLLGAGGSPRRR